MITKISSYMDRNSRGYIRYAYLIEYKNGISTTCINSDLIYKSSLLAENAASRVIEEVKEEYKKSSS